MSLNKNIFCLLYESSCFVIVFFLLFFISVAVDAVVVVAADVILYICICVINIQTFIHCVSVHCNTARMHQKPTVNVIVGAIELS